MMTMNACDRKSEDVWNEAQWKHWHKNTHIDTCTHTNTSKMCLCLKNENKRTQFKTTQQRVMQFAALDFDAFSSFKKQNMFHWISSTILLLLFTTMRW